MSSVILTAFALSITLFQISCSKESHATPTENPLTKDQILVQHTWKVDQLHHVIGGQYSSYVAGGSNSTGIPYENLRFKFNSDGSGTHIDQFGTSHTMSWVFSSTDKRSLQITVPDLNPATFEWQMVEIAGNYLHATVNLLVGNDSNNLESFRLIQVP